MSTARHAAALVMVLLALALPAAVTARAAAHGPLPPDYRAMLDALCDFDFVAEEPARVAELAQSRGSVR